MTQDFAQSPSVHAQDNGPTWPLLLAEPLQAGASPISVQALVAQWHGQAFTTGLSVAPEMMIIQLNRFNLQGRPRNHAPVKLDTGFLLCRLLENCREE